MDKQDTANQVRELGLLAVLRGPSPDLTLKTVDALVAVGLSSALCPRVWAEEGRFDDITARAEAFTATVAEAR